MPGGFTGGIEKGLKLAIPLAMKSMDLDMARAKLDLETQQYQDELFKEAQEIEKEAIEAKRKIAVDSVERTKEALDAAHKGNAAPDVIAELKAQQAINLEKAGLPPQIIPRILQEDEVERDLRAKLKETTEITTAEEKAREPFVKAKERRALERKGVEDIAKQLKEEGKFTKGTPYVNDKGQRVVPLFDQQGEFVKEQVLGKALIKEKAGREPSPQQALKRISTIKKSIATLEKADKVDTVLMGLFPQLEGQMGQKIPAKQKQELLDAYNEELTYLQQFKTSRKKIDHGAITRTGTTPLGKRVVEYEDGYMSYAD